MLTVPEYVLPEVGERFTVVRIELSGRLIVTVKEETSLKYD